MADSGGDWFYFSYIYFLPLWIGIWRWAAYIILKAIPSLLYKPIPISDDLEPGHVPVSTQMMTMIVPVYMPEPGFEECLQSWVDNRPKTIVVVVDTNSYQQVRSHFQTKVMSEYRIKTGPFLVHQPSLVHSTVACIPAFRISSLDLSLPVS